MNKNYKSVLLAIGLFLGLTASVSAAPGDLDPTFGNGGIVITRGNSLNHLNTGNAMAIQADGKIAVVGEGALGNTWDFAVVRYNTDGSLDTSFGGSGIVITPVGDSHDQAYSVAIQADGKIVVGGTICNGVGNCSSAGSSMAVVRYNTNGSLDTSFNGTGKIINSASSFAGSLAIQADGKIVVAGGHNLFRYNPNGSLDTSFNGTGIVIIQSGWGVGSVEIQSDGKIIAAGAYPTVLGGNLFLRYNTDGTPDTTFNGTGSVPMAVGFMVAIQADGKIVNAGNSNNGMAVGRYNPNGSLDTTFGGIGEVSVPIDRWNGISSVTIQTDGKIVVAGTSAIGDLGRNFVVVRFNPNGSLDTTFGGTGKVITPFCCQSFVAAAAIQADGKIIVAGGIDDILYDFHDFVVIRYEGGSNANIRTRFDFDGDGRADVSVFRPSDRVWYLNQSTNGFSATQFGLSADRITPADFDGDGQTDISVYRDGVWYRLNSSNQSVSIVPFGNASDIPVPADYTGDGRAELAVYRNGVWWTLDLTNNQTQVVNFGLATDKPVVADYDGDGRADQAIYRDGEWHLNRSAQGYTVADFGLATDKPIAADYDGDGKTDLAVYRDGTWYLLQSTNGFAAFSWGIASDIPAPADYDGDGKTDAAVFRNGTWYLRQTTSGDSIQQFGSTNDKPVPAAYLP
jgi:uncharacterized delta-60 repeat protein